MESEFIEHWFYRYHNCIAAICQILLFAKTNTGSLILDLIDISSLSDIACDTGGLWNGYRGSRRQGASAGKPEVRSQAGRRSRVSATGSDLSYRAKSRTEGTAKFT